MRTDHRVEGWNLRDKLEIFSKGSRRWLFRWWWGSEPWIYFKGRNSRTLGWIYLWTMEKKEANLYSCDLHPKCFPKVSCVERWGFWRELNHRVSALINAWVHRWVHCRICCWEVALSWWKQVRGDRSLESILSVWLFLISSLPSCCVVSSFLPPGPSKITFLPQKNHQPK